MSLPASAPPRGRQSARLTPRAGTCGHAMELSPVGTVSPPVAVTPVRVRAAGTVDGEVHRDAGCQHRQRRWVGDGELSQRGHDRRQSGGIGGVVLHLRRLRSWARAVWEKHCEGLLEPAPSARWRAAGTCRADARASEQVRRPHLDLLEEIDAQQVTCSNPGFKGTIPGAGSSTPGTCYGNPQSRAARCRGRPPRTRALRRLAARLCAASWNRWQPRPTSLMSYTSVRWWRVGYGA
jgi:hypothetical protein